MSMPLLQYLENPPQAAEPAKGSLPDKQEWVDFCEFALKGKRLCVCDSWSPFDGVAAELPPGKYDVKALCYSYGNDVRVAALRIAQQGTQGQLAEPVGEFGVDVGTVGITDLDLVESMDDDSFGEWIEAYSYADNNPRAGRHPCPEAGTEMLFAASGWGDGWYTVHSLKQGGQPVGVEARFIEENEPYPFSRHNPTPPSADEVELIDELIVIGKEIGLSTEPIDRDACIAAFSAIYAAKGMPTPEFVFCTSLMDMRDRAGGMIAKDGDLEGVAGEELTLIEGIERGAYPAVNREDGILDYTRDPLTHFDELKMGETDAEDHAGASRPDEWESTYGMATTTWSEMRLIVIRLALEKLGLRQPDERFHLAAHALSTCGGASCYERYCFISERPARIVHPAITPGASAGRCRIEWRDGFVCDEEL